MDSNHSIRLPLTNPRPSSTFDEKNDTIVQSGKSGTLPPEDPNGDGSGSNVPLAASTQGVQPPLSPAATLYDHHPQAPIFMNADTSDEIAPQTISSFHSSVADIWMSAQPQIASLRDVVLTLRTSLRRENQQLRQQEDALKNILDGVMTFLKSNIASPDKPGEREVLHQLHQEMNIYTINLNAHRDRVASLEDHLSNNEYKMQRIEELVYRQLDKETGRLASQPPQTTEKRDEGEDIGLLEQLYSRMGDVRIFLERLNNFEADVREQLDERDVLRVAGHSNLDTDADFLRHSRMNREAMQRDLDDAQAQVQALKDECIHHGIEFDEPQLPALLYHTEMEARSLNSDSSRSMGAQPSVPASIVDTLLTKEEFVEQWLDPPSPMERPASMPVSRSQWRVPTQGTSLLEALQLDSWAKPRHQGTKITARLGSAHPSKFEHPKV
ncbi:hypothetical protein T440DRAFT_521569 [Plenodomus tracheiphilus IPT5]|uniref:Uncharacterized protein n=1 Tax=Plenodomus tracheiphilus IPT5 TaxID=1408161 RepID=A0A6A7AUQ0_9PLEO|nr:hypothetical protein T440DRAFT_521569 [Plenodomus tracheiphilus IPT5]